MTNRKIFEIFQKLNVLFYIVPQIDRFISHREWAAGKEFQLARALSFRHYLAASNISIFSDCAL